MRIRLDENLKIDLSETQRVKAILEYLKYREGMFWRQNTGSMSVGGRFVKFGIVGASDITGLRRSRRIEIEVKTEKGRLSDDQKIFRDLILQNGGDYLEVRSVDDVIEAGL